MKWVQLYGSFNILWHCPSLGNWNENWLFQSCGHCWVFQICWHIQCSTLTASSCRILNSSPRNPALLQALLVVMLPKAHLTSHSRISSSMWVTTPSWLSGPLDLFCTVLLCTLNLFCFCLVLTISALYGAHPCMKCSLDISNFLEEICRLFYCFPLFLCII